MLKWLILAAGLIAGPAAVASTPGTPGAPPAPAASHVTEPKTPKDLVEEKQEEKSEQEKAAEERLKAIEAAEAQKLSRVVILKWPETEIGEADHLNETLTRNIKTRIARPDAKFYPEIDLYQAGRKEPNETVRPVDQRAIVPSTVLEKVMAAVDEVSTIPWNALSEQDWALKAYELRELANEVWFVDRVELREPLFLLYTQIGYAAENSNNPSPPFFEQVGTKPVNYYWYLAATMANEQPDLMAKLTNQEMYASINYYKDSLDRGEFKPMTLGFELEGKWDAKEFAGEYQIFINGLEKTITTKDGLWDVNPGRVDVYMARGDGHSLSESVTLAKLENKVYFVRDVARKRMGKDFIDMLMEHPFECTPQVDGDILTYLSIYAKLHPEADVYVGLAKGGSIASRNIYLWRWDRPSATLQKVLDDTGGFPVRFVALIGTGLIFNGMAEYTNPTPETIAQETVNNPDNPTAGLDAARATAAGAVPSLNPSAVPVNYELRGHYGRLMVTTGIDFAANLTGNPWQDKFQTDSKKGPDNVVTSETTTDVTFEATQEECDAAGGSLTGSECTLTGVEVEVDVLRERSWQRLVFLGIGGVLGRNAAIGFGPRGFIRTGWYNAPHALDLTGHVGYASMLPFVHATGRVRPIADLDFYGGVLIPFRDSVFVSGDKTFGKVQPTLGTTLSIGLTF